MTSKARFSLLLIGISLFLAGGYNPKPLTSQQILDLVNQDRATQGLANLSLN